MCLAVPMKLVLVEAEHGWAELNGVGIDVMLTLTPEAQIGDYVIVHAGYALSILDADEAEASLQALRAAMDTHS
jgi:hydrogenase expression/formation protein HypC